MPSASDIASQQRFPLNRNGADRFLLISRSQEEKSLGTAYLLHSVKIETRLLKGHEDALQNSKQQWDLTPVD